MLPSLTLLSCWLCKNTGNTPRSSPANTCRWSTLLRSRTRTKMASGGRLANLVMQVPCFGSLSASSRNVTSSPFFQHGPTITTSVPFAMPYCMPTFRVTIAGIPTTTSKTGLKNFRVWQFPSPYSLLRRSLLRVTAPRPHVSNTAGTRKQSPTSARCIATKLAALFTAFFSAFVGTTTGT
eukprot:Pompholyxophrys_sp_v1_NODE_7_length_5994_cov_24.204748.p4 type:complete len:180 gc:universal NODE_7_length_5994_cov_24.204748:1657-2196(+)